MSVQIGDQAPNFSLADHTGQRVSLSDYRDEKRVILFFVRTPTCWQCRKHVEQLGRHYADLRAAGCEVLVLLHGDETTAQNYADAVHAPFPILADERYEVYQNYGLYEVFLLVTRTASVIIEKNGTISYMHSAINPFTWLSETASLIEHLREDTTARFAMAS